MTGPEDQPTEPLRPREPVARAAVVTETVPDDTRWAALLDDRLRSLKSMVALLAVLALAALGLAIYALVRDNDTSGGDNNGASAAHVAQLDDRVSALESKADKAATKDDIDRLDNRIDGKAGKQQVADLSSEVDDLRKTVEQNSSSSGTDSNTTQAIQQIDDRLDQLEQDVKDLQDQQSQGQ